MPETARSDIKIATELDVDAAVSQASARPAGILIGDARCSAEKQDLTAQRQILQELGVTEDRVYPDHGLTGTNRSRPGLNNALAALREGDTLVVPKLDRLARSVPDARAIGDSFAPRGVRLSLGGSVNDPNDPMGKCFFNILARFAEFEADLLRIAPGKGWPSRVPKADSRAKRPSSARPTDGPAQAPPSRGTLDRRASRTVLHQPRHRLPRARTNTRQEVRRRRSLSDPQ